MAQGIPPCGPPVLRSEQELHHHVHLGAPRPYSVHHDCSGQSAERGVYVCVYGVWLFCCVHGV